MVIPIEHFSVGLRLPLWPEIRIALRYYGLVLAQLNPNSVAMLVAFACYMREERIEFSLSVFRKLFSFRAKKDGLAFFSGQNFTVVGTVNKNHHWLRKFIFVSGDLGKIPFAPVQKSESTYKPPALSDSEMALHSYILRYDFDVVYLRRHVDTLLPVEFEQGERAVPLNPPRLLVGGLSRLAASAAELCREDTPPPPSRKRKEGLAPTPPPKRPALASTPRAASFTTPRQTPAATPTTTPPPPKKPLSASEKGKQKIDASRASLAEKDVRTPGSATAGAAADKASARPSDSSVMSVDAAGKPLPGGNKNFGFGEYRKDSLDEPILSWDPKANRVSVSTLLPSWREGSNSGSHAYAFAFATYGRKDTAEYLASSEQDLAYEGSRAALRSLEHSHMLARRCVRMSKELRLAKAASETTAAEMATLKERAETAEQALNSLAGGVDAETADQLYTRIASLEEEVAALQMHNRTLVEAVLPPLPKDQAKAKLMTNREIELQMQGTAISAGRHMLKTLQQANFLTGAGAKATLKDICPELYIPLPEDSSSSAGGQEGSENEGGGECADSRSRN